MPEGWNAIKCWGTGLYQNIWITAEKEEDG